MTPGQLLKEGVVVRHDQDNADESRRGVYVGREAAPGEACPPRHSEHHFTGGLRVFLSVDQAPIPPAGLHKRGK